MTSTLITLVGLCCALTPPHPVEDSSADHAVYLELGGSALFYGLHYEYALWPSWRISAGVSALGVRERQTGAALWWALNPIMGHYLLGGGGHHLELGLGGTWGIARGDLNEVGAPRTFVVLLGTGFLGYRYHRRDGGLVVRAGLAPFFGGRRFAPLSQRLQWWGGASVGWSF